MRFVTMVVVGAILFVVSWQSAPGATQPEGTQPEATLPETTLKAPEAPSHYCGIHCVYAASQLYGISCEFADLADPRYVTSMSGSSAADLARALNDIGLKAYENDFMTFEQLALLDRPTILHVRTPVSRLRYTHWVLFLGLDGDKVRLYDPPDDVETVTVAELLSIWDGVGLIVADHPSAALIGVPFALSFFAFVIGAVLAIWVMHRWLPAWALVLTVPLAVAAAAHVLMPTGFLRSHGAIVNVQETFVDLDVPEVAFAEAQRLVAFGACTVVDARQSSAYATFHLPEAINIPIDASFARLARESSAIDRKKPVIVYCAHDHCPWAQKIAAQLAARGVRDISVYRGGVREWRVKSAQNQGHADQRGKDG